VGLPPLGVNADTVLLPTAATDAAAAHTAEIRFIMRNRVLAALQPDVAVGSRLKGETLREISDTYDEGTPGRSVEAEGELQDVIGETNLTTK